MSEASERSAPARRRAHRKSKTGCKPCKTGRIKCDENRPFCKNCRRKDVLCEYFDTKSHERGHPANKLKISPTCSQSTVEAKAILPIEARSNLSSSRLFAGRTPSATEQLLERQLLHHFLEMTQQATDIQVAWSFWVLEQATQSPCVMNAILGISAFHLRKLNEFNIALQEASHGYMARAIEDHKKHLSEGMKKSNPSNVAAACAIVVAYANVSEYYLVGDYHQRMPHDWYISCRRAMTLFHIASPWIDNPVISQELLTLQPNIYQDTHSKPFIFLLDYNPPSTILDREEIGTCLPAVTHLSYIYAELATKKPLRFPVDVSARFVDLVAAKNPRALAISGYFFMLVKLGRQFWWVDGAPEREFGVIMRHLPRNWWPAMDWAVRVFEWDERK